MWDGMERLRGGGGVGELAYPQHRFKSFDLKCEMPCQKFKLR